MNEPLAEIAAQLEEGDSLAELVQTLLSARLEALPDSPLRRLLTAMLTAVCWERLGVDPLDRRRASVAYRLAAEERPAPYRVGNKLTPDELAALGVLAGYRRQSAEETEHRRAG